MYVLVIMQHLITLFNGVDDIFQTSKTYNEKIIILIIFQNSKIKTLTREKINHYYNNNIESKWTHQRYKSWQDPIIY
jgi:hypothetical protein